MPEHPEPKARPHPWTTGKRPPSSFSATEKELGGPSYADLHVTSNFSFLRGASHPEELVARAAALGHEAVAVTDVNTLAGIVRAHIAAREAGIRLVVGCRLALFRALRSGLRPHTRSGGYAADSIGRYAVTTISSAP